MLRTSAASTYTQTSTRIHIETQTETHSHMLAHAQPDTHACAHTRKHKRTYECMHAHAHACKERERERYRKHTHTHAFFLSLTHTYRCTYILTRKYYIYMYICIYRYMHICLWIFVCINMLDRSTDVCTYVCRHMYETTHHIIHIYIHTCICLFIYTYVCMYVCTYPLVHTFFDISICITTYSICILILIYMSTHILRAGVQATLCFNVSNAAKPCKGNVLDLSKDKYGCRVVQKMTSGLQSSAIFSVSGTCRRQHTSRLNGHVRARRYTCDIMHTCMCIHVLRLCRR